MHVPLSICKDAVESYILRDFRLKFRDDESKTFAAKIPYRQVAIGSCINSYREMSQDPQVPFHMKCSNQFSSGRWPQLQSQNRNCFQRPQRYTISCFGGQGQSKNSSKRIHWTNHKEFVHVACTRILQQFFGKQCGDYTKQCTDCEALLQHGKTTLNESYKNLQHDQDSKVNQTFTLRRMEKHTFLSA